MAKTDIFKKPFDEGTLAKLKIFDDYFKEWLPVFITRKEPIWKEIKIFDLFGGQGKDVNGVYGSPLRILSTLNKSHDLILKSNVKIKVIINEFDKEKYDILVNNIKGISVENLYSLELYNDDFNKIFNEYYEGMKISANFLFLDQNGIKQITENIFFKLINLRQTDFLFFISSSFIRRFSELEEFNRYLKITKQDLDGKSYYHIHRVVLGYYRSLIPDNKSYFLAPFSIKKVSGIYGLIFGTNHTLGIEKFLSVCWKYDRLTGEANFDIDNEKININNPGFFAEYNIPTKKQMYENNLTAKILNGELKTDFEIYLFTLNEGFLPKDANVILIDMHKKGKVKLDFELTNSNIHKMPRQSTIKLN